MSLLNLSPSEFCAATEACEDGRDWALTQPTMADVWDNCPRPDWLLWITDKLGQRPDDRTLRLFAVWCARNTPMPDGRKSGDLLTDSHSLDALEVAERFADGQATGDELATAWAAVWVAVPDFVYDAAWDAARDAEVAAEVAAANPAWAAAAAAAQTEHFRTLVPNPFRKEAQP